MEVNPFDSSLFLGYVSFVSPEFTKVHFPASSLLKKFTFDGEDFNGGLVGEYVVIESNNFGFLGKINQVFITEKERPGLSESSFKNNEFQPLGHVELLLAFDHYNPLDVKKGLTAFPQVGSKVFVCSSKFVQAYLKNFGVKEDESKPPLIDLAHLVSKEESKVTVSQQGLFGRHCAVVGTTGGGKSWTVSKLVQEVTENEHKSIIIDATGEYSSLDNKSFSYEPQVLAKNSYLHYTNLTTEDLFVLFRPSGQVQQPILLDAIRSLKIVNCLLRDINDYKVESSGNKYTFKIKTNLGVKDLIVENGCIVKQNNATAPFKRVYYKYAGEINDLSNTDFNINNLATQIVNECYYDNGDNWSNNRDDRTYGHSTSLIMRIRNLLSNDSFKEILGFEEKKKGDLADSISSFLKSKKKVLRIGFENVFYDFQAREIIANSIGSYLLGLAREGRFDDKVDSKNAPLILFVDEAHQFLNKSVKDEYFETTRLQAFDQIAKECRKHGLFLTISTQMPRDIPTGTLSQMGTFITHRLINYYDKEAIANACSSANKNALDYLPILGEGEAVLMGIDFPMPLVIKVREPSVTPNSETPRF